jgi:hypothetical protein
MRRTPTTTTPLRKINKYVNRSELPKWFPVSTVAPSYM